MTQTPQGSDAPDTASPSTDGDAPAQSFRPFLDAPAPVKPSRKPLILLGGAVLLVVGGLIFWSGGPDDVEARSAAPNYRTMTAEELAKDAGSMAAMELARRMVNGTPAEQASASSAFNHWPSPRLARNLAMAMAVESQKKQQQRMRELEIQQRMVEYGR